MPANSAELITLKDEETAVMKLRGLNHGRKITLRDKEDFKEVEENLLADTPWSEHKTNINEVTYDQDGWEKFSGFLEKLSPTFSRGWQKRWVNLWCNELTYYKDNTCVHRGLIKLEDVSSIKQNVSALTEFDITHHSKRGTYHWRCPTDKMCSRLVDKLTNNWKLVQKKLKKDKNTFSGPALQLNDIMTPMTNNHFMREGQTGDIVLFRSRQAAGAIVRKATNGEVDHIGLIFRLKNKKSIALFEALGSCGVQIFSWRNFEKEKWHEQYSKIYRRKLHIPDTKLRKQVRKTLHKFLKVVANRNYSWTPLKQMRKVSLLPHSDPNRTFFCSELVASAFKEAGLLRKNCPSTRYLPTTFEERKGLLLLNGAFLGPEQQISFATKKPEERNTAKNKPERTSVVTVDDEKVEIANAPVLDGSAQGLRLCSPV